MDRKINILIYPSGSENALEVKEALSYKVNINVFGASSKKDHSEFVYKNYFDAPNVKDEDFLEKFNKLLEQYNIDFIIPTHDTVAFRLSELREFIKGIVITSPFETNKICRFKKLTYQFFNGFYFCPKIFKTTYEIDNWPVFLKPNVGEGGKNSLTIMNLNELNCIDLQKQDYIMMEFLPGNEFTIDCFTDRFGNLRYTGARERRRIWGGISVNSITIYDEEIFEIAKIINSKLKFRGYWFFQLKKDVNNNYKLLEISTRPAGTMAVYRQRGINFILLSIYDFLEYDYEIIDNGYNVELDRCLFARYKIDYKYDSIYLDFDDTLIFNNRVNPWCLLLLYQAKERNIPVVLITRHKLDIVQTLELYNIPISIFNSIEILYDEINKANFIKHNKPIFIDNSFNERINVYKKLNIPVLDTDNIISLIDWRT